MSIIKNHKFIRLGYLNHVILLSFLITPMAAISEAAPKILIIHSYYQVSQWTDDIMDGMMSVLASADEETSIYTEFLDAQRIEKEEFWPSFENYLKAKYLGENFDVILASDDDILDFLIPRYKDIFPGTPFVFCGINNLDENKFKQHKAFIGISQEIDVRGTIELALKLLPRTEKFLVISDRTSAGIKTTAKFKQDIKQMNSLKLKFHLIDDFTLNELKAHLQTLGPNDLVLVIRIQKIKGIDERNPAKFMKIVTDASPVPSFRVWGTVKSDFVGGVLVSAFAQGKAAAEIGLRILKGENVHNIPQVIRSPNVPVLNYAILKKFNISENNIPEGTTVINRPIPILEKYRRQVYLFLIICLILVLIICFLATILYMQRKNEKIILQGKKALHESNQKYQSMVNSIGIGVALISPEMQVIEMNKQMRQWFPNVVPGYGTICYRVFNDPPIDQICDYCPTCKSIQDGRTHESVTVTPAGKSTRNFRIISSPILDKNGHVKAAIEMVEDITERLIVEKKNRQSHKMESIGNLAGGIAHDFNNVLAAIIGFTELALDEVDNGTELADYIQEVYLSSIRAKNLVRQILTYARQSEENKTPIQLGRIANEVLRFIRSSIPTTIEINSSIESDSMIMGSATHIHQIIMNLCTNAAHAMEDEGGVLEVTLKDTVVKKDSFLYDQTIKPGDYVELKVADTGKGIPNDIKDSIFEPYFTTKGPGEGTGMGLAVVHGIVESSGGKIIVESKLMEGSTFTVFIPITQKRRIDRAYESEMLPSGTERILFVDDETLLTKMGSQILGRLGYSVTTRNSSIEALELFKVNPNNFDLVVTDMTMPNMAGDQLAKELMKIRSNISVILCTGYSNKISDEAAHQIGIKAFAYKPMVKAEIARTVRKVLDDAKLAS